MPWIKIQTNLKDAPEVSAIGARLRMTEHHVVGCLVAIWSWADTLTADGFVAHATAAAIDRLAGKKGFAAAMEAVGWLRIEPAAIIFPRWDRHNGESAKARAGEAESKRLYRAGKNRTAASPESGRKQADKSGQESGQESGQIKDNVPTRGEERREEEYNPAEASARGEGSSTPPAQADPAFAAQREALAAATEGAAEGLSRRAARNVEDALYEIRRLCPDLTPHELSRRAENYRKHFRTAALTAQALAAHWARCDAPPTASSGGVSSIDGDFSCRTPAV